jgi:hypothetical protein
MVKFAVQCYPKIALFEPCPDTDIKEILNEIAAQIKRDMQADYFDRSLLQYRPSQRVSNASKISA